MNEDVQERAHDDSTAALTWRLDAVQFNKALIEVLRRRDTVLPRVAMDEISHDLIELIPGSSAEQEKDVMTMLDRLADLGASALRFNEQWLFDNFVRTSLNIYLSGFDERGNIHQGSAGEGVTGPVLWLNVVARNLAVGAYAVRLEEWAAVRKLALQSFPEIPYMTMGGGEHWLRHAITHASREGLLRSSSKKVINGSELIAIAHEVIDADPALRCDLPQRDVRLLNSILQFDLLALLVVTADLGVYDTSHVYPSMAGWGIRRAEPVVVKLLSDHHMQEGLFSRSIDEKLLSKALKEVQAYALRLNFSNEMGWSSQPVRELLSRNRD